MVNFFCNYVIYLTNGDMAHQKLCVTNGDEEEKKETGVSKNIPLVLFTPTVTVRNVKP